ncbi:MAG TPA: hypothetical protein VE621_24680 [Bryobacteraceae bacterium]|nr:hypothetical protein [Bryobacteraceae bacterium]
MAQGPGLSSNISEAEVRDELNRILAGHEFRGSKRSQDFLRYVVENTLNGHSDTLKERTIGVEVFGRLATYHPSDDATVRVKAGEVRKRLGLYYAAEGAHDRVRIELPPGTYIPEFRWSDTEKPVEDDPALDADHPPSSYKAPAAAWTRARLAAALGLVAAAFGAFYWLRVRSPLLDQFWSPVLEGDSPVSICAAYVPVYALDRDADATHKPRAEDFTLLTDQFVGGGDLMAVSRLSAMLARMRRPYSVRIGDAVSFHDLRTTPAILVGYSYTRWREISSQMRFFIDTSRRPAGITDNGAPTTWSLPNLPADQRTDEDYAIITRVFHPDTHAMLVEVAGITQYGTDAAADLITQNDLLAEALKRAPADWKKKNLQMVLHVKVISGVPTSPRVVAAHFW